MEFYRLRSFVVVAEELHVGRAADRLRLAQPTLSRQIAALEGDLGVLLFSRDRRRLRLTSAGQVFLEHARDLLQRADGAAVAAKRAAAGELGELRLAFVQSATYEALPELLGRFRQSCPEVRLKLSPLTTLRQLPALLGGGLDVGLLRPRQPRAGLPDLRTHVISHDPWTVALPAGHRLARLRRVRVADLATEDFVLYASEAGSTGHDQILDGCRAAGFEPRIIQETADAQTTVAMVAAGLGVSLLLRPAPPMDPGLVAYRPLRDPWPGWDLAIAWSPDNPSATLRRFLELAGVRPASRTPGKAGIPTAPAGGPVAG
ncbi:LysR family transcriptional regulator [Microlunatus speluncae]|uniref:LysR family transcriptional regulator n=1 Tax=Microlunatus speluncae TaxID=2594267 RepID=UPI001266538D|nr:LysR family transcriptional regulator [Microlunatus speluncae]